MKEIELGKIIYHDDLPDLDKLDIVKAVYREINRQVEEYQKKARNNRLVLVRYFTKDVIRVNYAPRGFVGVLPNLGEKQDNNKTEVTDIHYSDAGGDDGLPF